MNGIVNRAEAADINADGSPEIHVYVAGEAGWVFKPDKAIGL
jgi:hypothetical protein